MWLEIDLYDPAGLALIRLSQVGPGHLAMIVSLVSGAPALRLSAQRSRLRRELPQHVVLGLLRTLPSAGSGGARARGRADHARRSRAERIDIGDAPRRLDAGEPVCLHRCGDRRAMGFAARRRQPRSVATLAEIGSIDRIPQILRRAKDKNDPFRLMGFGHRVYRSYDPREDFAPTLPRSARRAGTARRSPPRTRDGAREDRARGRLFHRA